MCLKIFISHFLDGFVVGSPDGYNKQMLSQNDEPSYMYYLNDGLYGSFNSLMYDHAKVEPCVLNVSPYTPNYGLFPFNHASRWLFLWC